MALALPAPQLQPASGQGRGELAPGLGAPRWALQKPRARPAPAGRVIPKCLILLG